MGTILLIIYILLTLIINKKRNLFFSITLIYMIIAPDIKFNNFDISATYFIIIYLGIIFCCEKKYVLFIKKENKDYLVLIALNFIFYLVMTLIKNDTWSSSEISNIIGFLKIPLCIIIITTLFKNEMKNRSNYDLIFKIVIIINLIGVILQFVFDYNIRSFFESMYLTNDYTYYSSLPDKNVYNRKFGFFSSPMLLGIFSLLAFCYFLVTYNEKLNKNFLYIILSLMIGLTSLSKTFILGVPMIFILDILFNIILMKNISKREVAQKVKLFIVILPVLILIFVLMYSYMSKTTSINYYLRMIKNPFKALETRYNTDSENLLLGTTYKVIKENIVFGVGFTNLVGEFLGDSTYVLALHHGGIISILSIIIYYLRNIIKSISEKNRKQILFIIVWILSGLAMPTLFNMTIIVPFYLYFCTSEKLEE